MDRRAALLEGGHGRGRLVLDPLRRGETASPGKVQVTQPTALAAFAAVFTKRTSHNALGVEGPLHCLGLKIHGVGGKGEFFLPLFLVKDNADIKQIVHT